MPCTVSRWEEESWEKECNQEVYGLRELDARITTRVACELGKLVEKYGLLEHVSPLAKKWLERHAEEDVVRG